MQPPTSGHIRIGTSGIVVPGTKATFPEAFQAGSRLHYYAALFNTLEINSSFYKIPLPTTFAKWATEVGQDFTFTVKLWRDISHAKKLDYRLDDIDLFMQAANHLGTKAGCLLIQFPASITYHYQRKVGKILERLTQLNSAQQWQLAVEVRHTSWYQRDAYALFEKYNTSLVLHDMPTSKTPFDYVSTKTLYLRFHGPHGDYKDSYSDSVIRHYAEHITDWRAHGKDLYIYFNNTIGSALANAQLLQTLL